MVGLAIVAVAVVVSLIAPWGNSTTIPQQPDRPGSVSHVAPTTEASSTLVGEPGAQSSFDEVGTWVHVVGAVRKPGLYLVDPGSRVVDAIMAAGGLSDEADQCALNLARPLADGEQLVVPNRAIDQIGCGTQATGGGHLGAGLVSLSRADLATLDSLPGIGPTLAQRIIDWRVAHGGFTSVEQLGEVTGIGDKLFAEISPLVTP